MSTKYEVEDVIEGRGKATKKLKCDCYNTFQDKTYGARVRIHNKIVKGWRCTVCGKDKT